MKKVTTMKVTGTNCIIRCGDVDFVGEEIHNYSVVMMIMIT